MQIERRATTDNVSARVRYDPYDHVQVDMVKRVLEENRTCSSSEPVYAAVYRYKSSIQSIISISTELVYSFASTTSLKFSSCAN